MRWAIVDANEVAAKAWAGITASVVGRWLEWEAGQVGAQLVADAREADAVFLVFAGVQGWRQAVSTAMRRRGLEPLRAKRSSPRPLVIAGGSVAATPALALLLADCCVVGEGYRAVRAALNCRNLEQLLSWLHEQPNVLRPDHLVPFSSTEPYLLEHAPTRRVQVDGEVDWGTPAFESSDKVVRYVVSKGCHKKCAFCATTYVQPYSFRTDGERMLHSMERARQAGQRVQLVSNDPANLPWFEAATTHLESGSFTIDELRRGDVMRALRRVRPGMVRMGVEGLSERIRTAFGKAVADTEVVSICEELNASRMRWHLFFIAGAPGETEEDWAAFRVLLKRLRKVSRYGINRIKLTSFLPGPPAPLTAFRPDLHVAERYKAFRRWMVQDCASAHIVVVGPRRAPSYAAIIIEMLGLPHLLPQVRKLAREAGHWAPAVAELLPERFDHAPACLPWEIVQWPLPLERRTKVGEVYARRMGLANGRPGVRAAGS